MGLIYIPSDAEVVEQQLQNNSRIGNELLSKLKRATQHLTTVVSSGQLQGKAYNRGLSLMSDCILPTIQKVNSATESIQQDLIRFSSARLEMPNEPLYEDKLNAKIAELERQKAAQEAMAAVYQSNILGLIASAVTDGIDQAISQFTSAQSQLESHGRSIEAEIERTKEKLAKLQNFNFQTNALFQNSVSDLKIAMQGIKLLNDTKVSPNGQYVLPFGTDKSWFTSKKSTTDDLLENSGILFAVDDYTLDSLNISQSIKDNFKRAKMLAKANPANAFELLYKSESLWPVLDDLNKIAPKKVDLILNQLIKLEQVGNTKVAKSIKKAADIYETVSGSVGSVLEKFFKLKDKLGNIKFINNLGKNAKLVKFVGKAGAVGTFASMAFDGITDGVEDGLREKDIGKGIIGGVIGSIKNVGPLEGMTLGAAGGPAGIIAGGLLGTANTVIQFFYPNIISDFKQGAFSIYDHAKEYGTSICQNFNTFVDSASNFVGDSIGQGVKTLNSSIKINDVFSSFSKIKLGW